MSSEFLEEIKLGSSVGGDLPTLTEKQWHAGLTCSSEASPISLFTPPQITKALDIAHFFPIERKETRIKKNSPRISFQTIFHLNMRKVFSSFPSEGKFCNSSFVIALISLLSEFKGTDTIWTTC